MDHDTFWWRTTINMLSKYFEAYQIRRDEKDYQIHLICSTIRLGLNRIYNTQVKSQIRDPKKFIPLPWDEKIKQRKAKDVRVMTREEFDELVKKWDRPRSKKGVSAREVIMQHKKVK
jgi:hypothetical protein